jgi:hypothetical protein
MNYLIKLKPFKPIAIDDVRSLEANISITFSTSGDFLF